MSYSVEASVSTVTSTGIQHDKTKLILITTKEDDNECNLYPCVEAGISNYLNQTEKYSIGGSTEGPIYSTIDATNEDLHSFTYGQHNSTTPYASTSIMPFTTQTQTPVHSAEQLDDGHWITQPGPSGAQYAQPDRCNGEETHSSVFVQYRQIMLLFSSQHAVLAFKSKALSSTGLHFQFPQPLLYLQTHQLN